jgi:hypothetical protein
VDPQTTTKCWQHVNLSDWKAGSNRDDVHHEEKHSRVTFEIEPIGKIIRLTVTHDRLEAGSGMRESISKGWPKVLSSMKSFLEVGKPLPKLW